MALTTSLPHPRRLAGCGRQGLIARLLAVVLTVLAVTTLLCGTAMAVETPAGAAQAHPAPQAGTVAHAVFEAGMAGQADCDACVGEDGRAHCDSGLSAGVRDTLGKSGACAAPPPGQVPAVAAPSQAADVRGSPVSRPPDLHQLQVLRV
ncbi:hypothetical protein GCM10010095_21540 [Streptomyces anthocyanicus]|uniref:hypothetical protein n=1 Tax=Streptomyces anthocyanicus TaxID=68174 RepID=UPI00166FA56B|nr:hypothetical protein [Streptomyces anthocyanicus]GGL36036.1 hypothetical protein GCM10010095_21540 [Streptomyces anthocyanicus]